MIRIDPEADDIVLEVPSSEPQQAVLSARALKTPTDPIQRRTKGKRAQGSGAPEDNGGITHVVRIPLKPRVTVQVVRSRQSTAENLPYVVGKRIMDVCGSLVAILLLAPFMAVAALLVKLYDGGPVFYIHRRVGEGGREFTCYKFRSMRPDANERKAEIEHLNRHSDNRTFKMPNDPRVTPIGRWLRCISFDETPQLWNVLRGDMSLVGPRPPVPSEVARYSLRDMQRLTVKPGLTCLWQVSGRSRLPFPKQLELDLQYIQRRSLALDLKLLLLTIPAVISADGAC